MNTKGLLVTSRIAVLLAAGALTLAACSDTTGTARPTTETTSTPTTTSSPTSSSPSNGSLADTDPCTLLTTSEATEIGTEGTPKRQQVGSADTCMWKKSGAAVSVGIRTNLGLAQTQASGGQITDITVGGREAKQVSGRSSGSCLVVLGVSSSSRVDVTVTPPASGGDPCPLALAFAEKVEQKLP
ncbi:DUF3558 family protein [Lentzea atacamensis]|uniref:DUF3558 family protein n=1 Tax=Lentzea atacamensis TaxID=531938 RepID=UPI000D6C3C18|nr:DUF3558 family protein [Lentzea atacamensis]